MSDLREEVRERYAAAARSVKDGMAANDWDVSFEKYTRELSRTGFTEITIEATHELTDQMYGAIVRAHKGWP